MKLIITKSQDKVEAGTFEKLKHVKIRRDVNEWKLNINESIAKMSKAFNQLTILHGKCERLNPKDSQKGCVKGCVYYGNLFHELTNQFLIIYLDANRNLRPEEYGFSNYKLERFLNYIECIQGGFYFYDYYSDQCDFVDYFIEKGKETLFFKYYSILIPFIFSMEYEEICSRYKLDSHFCMSWLLTY